MLRRGPFRSRFAVRLRASVKSSKVDGAVFAHGAVGRQHHREGAHGVVHVPAEIAIVEDGVAQEALLAGTEFVVTGVVGERQDLVGARNRRPGPQAAAWMRSRDVAVWVSMAAEAAPSSATIETAPRGPITSFTKNAVSEIIGPQPASYQPTDPSAKSTWR